MLCELEWPRRRQQREGVIEICVQGDVQRVHRDDKKGHLIVLRTSYAGMLPPDTTSVLLVLGTTLSSV